ncbi:MAG: PQQ-binding-like beta-propeller repeat protein [Acidobacteriota bacterium]
MSTLYRFGLVLLLAAFTQSAAADWHRFRGPDGSGIASGTIPTEYSATRHLAWRVPLPGKGVSSPIIDGDRVYVTAYTGYGLDLEDPGSLDELVRHLLAFDRETGEELWRVSVVATGDEDPYQGFITQHGYASSTPVTDGEHVFALLGKSGLIAVDRDGKELWRRDLGQKSDPARWGDASSPILVDDVLVVNAGVLGHRVAGFDKTTGEPLWTVEDTGFTNSWSTPAVYRNGDAVQVLVHVPRRVMGIEPLSGDVLWSAASPIDDATSPSIVVHDHVAYLMGSRAGHAMAVRLDGRGDVSTTHVVWKHSTRAGITTPVVANGALYWASSGIFRAVSLATGKEIYKARLPRLGGPTGGFPNVDYSSPIVVGDHIVQFTRNG